MFLSMVKHIEEIKDRAERDFHRIKHNSLNNLYNWGENIFQKKYLMDLQQEDQFFERLQEMRELAQEQLQNSQREENKEVIN